MRYFVKNIIFNTSCIVDCGLYLHCQRNYISVYVVNFKWILLPVEEFHDSSSTAKISLSFYVSNFESIRAQELLKLFLMLFFKVSLSRPIKSKVNEFRIFRYASVLSRVLGSVFHIIV